MYLILKAKSINFLISKFKPIILVFLQFFAEIVKSTALCKLSLPSKKFDLFESCFCVKSQLQYFKSLEQQ